MSETTKAVDREETFDKLVAVRVRSELVDRVETLSEETISEELRNGLRARRLELEEEHDQLVTDGGVDVGRSERRSLIPVATKHYEVHNAAADVAHDAIEHGELDAKGVAAALREAADEIDEEDR